MKATKAILFTFLLALAAGTASAQRPAEANPAERVEKRTERLAEALDLSPEQAEQVRSINLEFAEQMRERRDALREEHKAVREAHKARIEAVLTDEQRQKMEALVEKREARRAEGRPEGRRGKGHRGPRPDRG